MSSRLASRGEVLTLRAPWGRGFQGQLLFSGRSKEQRSIPPISLHKWDPSPQDKALLAQDPPWSPVLLQALPSADQPVLSSPVLLLQPCGSSWGA